MKFFRLFFLLPLIVCCLLVSLFPLIDKHIPKEAGGINKLSKPIALREKADDSLQVVAYLNPHAFAVIENNNAKRWVYIYHDKKVLAVPRQEFEAGYVKVFGWVILNKYWNTSVALFLKVQPITLVAGMCLLILFILSGMKRKKANNRTKNKQEQRRAPSTIHIQEKKPEGSMPYNYSVKEASATYITDLDVSEPREKQSTVQELVDEAIEHITKEKDLEYKGQIEEMQAAAEAIQQEFDKAQEKALIFGLDLKDSNLDNLAKGRLFEVYGAKYWHKHNCLSILDWTPDKGFHHDIDVRSNGNPDFLIEIDLIPKKRLIAVEAKYRNGHFFLNPDETGARPFCAFEKRYKIERYRKYAIEKGCPVYILIGIGNTADDPEELYLVPISRVLELDAEDKFERLSMESKKVQKYKIVPEDFYSHFEQITESFYSENGEVANS